MQNYYNQKDIGCLLIYLIFLLFLLAFSLFHIPASLRSWIAEIKAL